MGRIKDALNLGGAIAVLAFGDIVLRECEVIENAVRVRPLLEDVIVLEKVIVAEGGMRQHKRLHRRGVFFQEVDDTRIGVDDDLVGEALPALTVEGLVADELLAEGPMPVKERHPRRGVSIEHLLCRYDLDARPVNAEPKLANANFRN